MTDTAACCNAAGKTRQVPEGPKLEGGCAKGGETHRPTATTWDRTNALEGHSQDAAMTRHIRFKSMVQVLFFFLDLHLTLLM